jgi:hypothetical protein
MDECAICYDTINGNDKNILKCNHIFHKNCIEKWFQKSHHCPLCRDSQFNKLIKEFENNYYKNQTKIINQMKQCDSQLFRIISPHQKFYWFNIDPENN